MPDAQAKPMPLPVSPDAIPGGLKRLRQWAGWSYEYQPKRNPKKPWTKVPKNPATGSNASSTNPKSWGIFDQAMARCQGQGLDGIGFVVTEHDDYVAVQAGVTLLWSQGPIEGHINRLKMLKRQMYGRARLDLLARRFLLAA